MIEEKVNLRPPVEKGQVLEVSIVDVTEDGDGIGKVGGFPLFIKEGIYGEVAKVKIGKVKKNYGFATKVDTVKDSPYLNDNPCPYLSLCGGCPLGVLNEEGRVMLKETQLKNKLTRLGGISSEKIIGFEPSPISYRYRNKAVFTVSTGGITTKKGGIIVANEKPKVGFLKKKSHEVFDCYDCALQSEAAMAAAEALRRYMEEDNLTGFDYYWKKGLIRHMMVRTCEGTGQVMVVVSIHGRGLPNGAKLVKYLDEYIGSTVRTIPDEVRKEMGLKPNDDDDAENSNFFYDLRSVYVTSHKDDSPINQLFGYKTEVIAGKATILDITRRNVKMEISPQSFYQVNYWQTENLYSHAMELAQVSDKKIVDLYGGIGSIGLDAMVHGGESLIGVETVKEATLNANRNAVINGVVNARFITGKAEEVFLDMKKPKEGEEWKNAADCDVIFLDPPRSGCDEGLLYSIAELNINKIVYISCNPSTMARDIKVLETAGYGLKCCKGFDMFPGGSSHVEAVALLELTTI